MRLPFWTTGFALLFVATLAQRGLAQTRGATPPRTSWSGVYTAAQAAQGEQNYMAYCVTCHPPGTYKGPKFIGPWDGRPLAELFDTMSEKMPKSDPGSLSPAEYAELVAYILKVNGMPAGKTPLPPGGRELLRIKFTLKAPAKKTAVH